MKKLLEYLILFPAMILLYSIMAIAVPTVLFLIIYLLGYLVTETVMNPRLPIIGIDVIVLIGIYQWKRSLSFRKSLSEIWQQMKWNK